MLCGICKVRRPRRFCPGVRADICTLCCGNEREVTVDCPLNCEYLQDSRKHDRLTPADPAKFPNQDIRVTEEFLQEHESLLVFMGRRLLEAALATPGAVDFDVREALDALIRTYRTLQSGVYYETRPENPLAAGICYLIQSGLGEFRKEETEKMGMTQTRDSDVLGMLTFLQRLELDHNNGRKRGRAFLQFLGSFFAEATAHLAAQPSSLILPP
jgi:hypothetical protein